MNRSTVGTAPSQEALSAANDARRWTAKTALLIIAGGFMVADMFLIFMWAPTEEVMGHVQRIFYIHVPMAWVAFLGFFLVMVGSVGYLWRRDNRWDALAHSAAEVGVIFTTLVLVTGVIWAKPVWGVWWAWEPKLTTSLVLWLIYVSYLVLRGQVPSPVQGARYSAVVGIVGFVDVPIVYFAAEWWRGLHPEPVVGPLATSGSLEGSMYFVLIISTASFTLLFAYLLWQRVAQRNTEDSLRQLAFSIRGYQEP